MFIISYFVKLGAFICISENKLYLLFLHTVSHPKFYQPGLSESETVKPLFSSFRPWGFPIRGKTSGSERSSLLYPVFSVKTCIKCNTEFFCIQPDLFLPLIFNFKLHHNKFVSILRSYCKIVSLLIDILNPVSFVRNGQTRCMSDCLGDRHRLHLLCLGFSRGIWRHVVVRTLGILALRHWLSCFCVSCVSSDEAAVIPSFCSILYFARICAEYCTTRFSSSSTNHTSGFHSLPTGVLRHCHHRQTYFLFMLFYPLVTFAL